MNLKLKNVLPFLFMTVLAFAFSTAPAQAQDAAKRPSPPKTATETVNGATVTINYSSPAVKNRVIWGELVPYGEVWRTGANEATTLTLEKAYSVGGKVLEPGKYALFTIPGEDKWTIILNKEWDQWGAYDYEQSEDAVRFEVIPAKTSEPVENLTFDINKDGSVVMKWEKLQLRFQLKPA